MKTILALIALISLSFGSAVAQEVDADSPLQSITLQDGRTILADGQGLSAYVFDVDTTSESQCYDSCATAWPPILVPEGAVLGENLGVTVRKDGSQQLTHKGRPIYLFIRDAAPGDITGDGVGGVWHLVIK